jgi:hypothetical protein
MELRKMNEEKYIKYAFYDETEKYIAIVDKDIPKEDLQKLQAKYDEVKFKE